MFLNPFIRRRESHALAVSMTGVKLGDRVAFIGCANGARLAAVAAKVGLSGRAAAVVPEESSAARARKGAENAGVLVEVEVAPLTQPPFEDATFDLAVVDDTADLFGAMSADDRARIVREIARILRPGGRIVFVGAGEAVGLSRLLARPTSPSLALSGEANRTLEANGFATVRTLAEREGQVFIEGIKPRGQSAVPFG
jgi:ubiquinone/menaquinone biosynthesis C-methylase UbiE